MGVIIGRAWIEGFEHRVLRKIFVPKRNEVTGECRQFNNKELHCLSLQQILLYFMESTRSGIEKDKMSGIHNILAEKI
jgi:hypothetical protein